MQYWLMKSEPDVWSIDQQEKAGIKGAPWDGVRNYQAAKNLKGMKKGDLCFFYHSNIGKEIVGIIEVIKESFLDKTDESGRFVAVQVRFREKLVKSVTLEDIKKNKFLINEYKVLNKFINEIMEGGKKTVAQKIVYGALDIIKEKSNEEDPLLRYLTKDTLTGAYDTSMEPTSIS